MNRVPYRPPILPTSIAERDSDYDSAFDVIEQFEVIRAAPSYPTKPRLVSSAHGPIRKILLWYGTSLENTFKPKSTYEDLLRLLPKTTEVLIAAHPDVAEEAEEVASRQRPDSQTTIIRTPDWLTYTVWAEDAFVVVEDVGVDPPVTFLLEPQIFPRAGDIAMADHIAQSTGLQATQLPLVFQGGNVLIGDDFVLIGRDYLDETIAETLDSGRIEGFPYDGSLKQQEAFITDLFQRTMDPEKTFHFLGTPAGERLPNSIIEIDRQPWLENVNAGVGSRQPIFHIDMFISLVGRGNDRRYMVLVGDPKLANSILGTPAVPHDLQSEFDAIAAQLSDLGFDVERNPLPYIYADDPRPVMVETNSGPTRVEGRRTWYHPTSNNCLVQIVGDKRDVWLPTYGHGNQEALRKTDDANKETWERHGFEVHQLGDFHPFAVRLGALHCIKKYIAR
jgi:hypothetical protein